jgi:hypothetical protein
MTVIPMVKLTSEEREHLLEMVSSDGYRILVQIIIPALQERRKARVFTQEVTGYDSLILLSRLAAQVEGAKELSSDISNLKALFLSSAEKDEATKKALSKKR